jgi:hypothetical protein
VSLTPQGNDYDQAKDPRDRLNREDRSLVVTELLKAGYPVRAMVRREDGRSTRLRAPGAEIAVAEMTDVERTYERVA